MNNDLISRQAAIETFTGMLHMGLDERDIVNAFEEMTPVDAVEVVRCNDCKWWKSSWKYCHYIHFDTDKNFYCAVGERRHDATFK